MAKHNKKRNVGLLHEQLVRHASYSLVRNDQSRSELAIEILQHHFRNDTELQREFRLFNALVYTRVPNREIAKQIIAESRIACLNHDANKLRVEKSHLIKEINHKIDDENFYRKKLPKYRLLATVQALLNEWRGAQRLGPDEVVKYENVLEEWLVRDAVQADLKLTTEADPLALKIMIEKFNKKYGALLNDEQKELLDRRLAEDGSELIEQIDSIKKRAMAALDVFYANCNNRILLEKRTLLERKISLLKPEFSDSSVSRAMAISALINELEEGDDE